MKIYDLYGFENDDIDAAKEAIQETLGIEFVPHESLYLGEYYLAEANASTFQLQGNREPLDGEYVEPDFPQSKVLLYINEASAAELIRQKLTDHIPGLLHLRREEA